MNVADADIRQTWTRSRSDDCQLRDRAMLRYGLALPAMAGRLKSVISGAEPSSTRRRCAQAEAGGAALAPGLLQGPGRLLPPPPLMMMIPAAASECPLENPLSPR